MNMKHSLSRDLLPFDQSLHSFKPLKRGRAIYLLLLVLLVLTPILLPLIEIDEFSASPGMIRTESEPVKVRARISGLVEQFVPRENSFVHVGDTLMTLRRDDLALSDSLLAVQIDSLKRQIGDLQLLVSSGSFLSEGLKSSLMRLSQREANRQSIRIERKRRRLKQELLKQRLLFEKGVISRSELETSQYEFQRSDDELRLYWLGLKTKWKKKLNQLTVRREELMIAHSRIEDQRKNLVIRASASGIIRHLEGVRNGSYVHKGAPLVEIIPEDRLIVKCLVSSEDVSLVKPQQEVVYQIPSLKKLGVGPVTGKVISIAPDMILEEGLPVFEVRCSLDSLPDSPSSSGKDNNPSMGQRKYLRNGMTLIARFRLARRTVFDLLLDRKEGTQTGRL